MVRCKAYLEFQICLRALGGAFEGHVLQEMCGTAVRYGPKQQAAVNNVSCASLTCKPCTLGHGIRAANKTHRVWRNKEHHCQMRPYVAPFKGKQMALASIGVWQAHCSKWSAAKLNAPIVFLSLEAAAGIDVHADRRGLVRCLYACMHVVVVVQRRAQISGKEHRLHRHI